MWVLFPHKLPESFVPNSIFTHQVYSLHYCLQSITRYRPTGTDFEATTEALPVRVRRFVDKTVKNPLALGLDA